MAVRLKDVAADLGVSMITVSKVLRNKPDVGEATRSRVLKRVEELGYRPNLMARGLASGRSYTIGLIVPSLVDAFFAEVATSLGAVLRGRGYQLIVASADGEPRVENEEIRNLLARGVDALLLASCRNSAEREALEFPGAVPYVLIDRDLAVARAHFVGTDDRMAGALATEHLIQLGRRQIAHIGVGGISTAVRRLEGYKDALKRHGLKFSRSLVVQQGLERDRGDQVGRSAMDQLLRRTKPPDGVFCYNDLIALGAVRSVKAAGLRVPEDVAVIGCGNMGLSSYLEVPLSSIDQSTAELGVKAGTLAVSLIGGRGKRGAKRILVAPKVVARASTLGVRPELDGS